MARFVGYIGYGFQVESAPGVYTNEIVEKRAFGDIKWDNRRFVTGDKVNQDLVMNNGFRVVADAYANQNFMNIIYVYWRGLRWKVTSVENEPPRMNLYVGELYNGPIPN